MTCNKINKKIELLKIIVVVPMVNMVTTAKKNAM